MGRKAPLAVGSRQGRSRNDVSGVHAEIEDSAFRKTEDCTMTRRIALLVVLGSVFVSSMSFAQETRASDEIQILPVRNNVYMLVSSAGNTTVQVGEDGVIIVDTMTSPLANSLLAAVRTLSKKP